MTTITADHLTRSAIVYIRQSTFHQVTNNIESGRRQYGLVERARQLGWNDVQVIDDDLGRSGGGIARPGFEKLLAAICERRVGAVLSIEASRLARNGRDWHTLLEFCGLVGTLIIDEDGIYDPRMPNDRLVLGMKGTMSGARVTIEAGRKRVIRSLRRNWSDWEILIKDHHEGYISWAEFERNQRLIADNANGLSYLGRGSVRRGGALLPGLFRCARCGRKLQVSYGGSKTFSQRYACRGAFSERAEISCISFGGMRVDRAVACEVIDRVQPFGIEAALAAVENLGREQLDKVKQLENAIEQARFEAARARRQYDAVDPENRLVAGDLERRWNQKLEALHALEEQLSQIHVEPAPSLQDADRMRLLTLGDDLSQAWSSPGVTMETRKKIVRLLISEIVVDVLDDKIALIIHWQGGDHTRLEVAKNKAGQTRWTTDIDIVKLVQVLARQMPDAAIAAALNRTRKFTGHGNGWTRAAVCSLRHQRGIAVYRDGERKERGEMTLDEAAQALNVSRSTVQRMIDDGILPADHPCPGAPWLVQAKDVERVEIQQEAQNRRSRRRPSSHDPRQNRLDL